MSVLVDVDVLVNGKPVTTYAHEGDTFIEGRSGSEYLIKIKNKTFWKVEVVVSVDGLSVIDGEAAGSESRGYVLSPYETFEVKGWRTSDENVAKFVFGDKENSYTAKLGNGSGNAGVIGIMAFTEEPPKIVAKPLTWTSNNYNDVYKTYYSLSMPVSSYSTSDTGSLSVTSDSLMLNQIGTEMGEEITSKVTTTKFTRSSLTDTTIIYYDSRKGLEARGIVVDQRKLKPDAFPANKYCKKV